MSTPASYTVVVSTTRDETTLQASEWKQKRTDAADMGYTPQIEQTTRETREVFKQTVETLDLAALVLCVNGIPPLQTVASGPAGSIQLHEPKYSNSCQHQPGGSFTECVVCKGPPKQTVASVAEKALVEILRRTNTPLSDNPTMVRSVQDYLEELIASERRGPVAVPTRVPPTFAEQDLADRAVFAALDRMGKVSLCSDPRIALRLQAMRDAAVGILVDTRA
jgi:hypothetical protein